MRIAIYQSRTGIDPRRNAQDLVSAIGFASAGGAQILFTPEMSGLLDQDRERASGNLRNEVEDEVVAAVREAAAECGLWVHLGSVALAGEREDDRLVNRGLLIDGSGAIRARYDKMHLFDVDLPNGERWRESAVYASGDIPVVAETPAGLLGMSICYDLRFGALYQALTDAGATLLAIPAAFTVPTGEAHWHVLLRARAIEAGVFVVAAAQSGQHDDGRSTFGHSLVVDPWGRIALDMGGEVGVGFADLDLDQVEEVRGRVPAIRHRRAVPKPLIVQ